MSVQTFSKDPDDVLDYVFDWSTWLGADTIASDTVTVATGLTKDSDSNTTTAVTVWLSGGTPGTSYKVTSKITTAAGRTKTASIVINVEEG
jgi:hypothetical protein